MSAISRSLRKVKRHWEEKGPVATLRAVAETLISPVLRRRGRMVYDILLTEPRTPSEWGPGEKLLVFGPENIGELGPELLKTMEPEKHREELDELPKGNRLFVVIVEQQCVYRGYIRIVDRQSHDRKAVFFDGLEALPEIRQAVATTYFRGKDLHKQVRKGLHTRVVNEQLRLLQSLGYKRAVLYIMAGNILSIKGNTAAGFQLLRNLDDWIFFDTIVFQRIRENGKRRWRVFLQ